MVINKTKIHGCLKMFPRNLTDDKKWITQTFSWDDLKRLNVSFLPKYEGQMHMRFKNTFRGIYYQMEPWTKKSLVTCVQGSALIVVVDVSKYSKTFLKYQIFECNPSNKIHLYITAGLAVGYLALEDDTKILVKSDQPFDVRFQRRLRWDDPEINIKWPEKYEIDPEKFVISLRDRQGDALWGMIRKYPDPCVVPSEDLEEDICGAMEVLENSPKRAYAPDAPVINSVTSNNLSVMISWEPDYYSQGYVILRREIGENEDEFEAELEAENEVKVESELNTAFEAETEVETESELETALENEVEEESGDSADELCLDERWTELIRLPKGCSRYTDFDVTFGVEYAYTVRSFAYNRKKSIVWSEFDQKGVRASLCSTDLTQTRPELISVTPQKQGLRIRWLKVDGVYGYQVLRKLTSESEWVPVADLPSNMDTYLDKNVEPGEVYVYTVRAYVYNMPAEKAFSDYNAFGLKNALAKK